MQYATLNDRDFAEATFESAEDIVVRLMSLEDGESRRRYTLVILVLLSSLVAMLLFSGALVFGWTEAIAYKRLFAFGFIASTIVLLGAIGALFTNVIAERALLHALELNYRHQGSRRAQELAMLGRSFTDLQDVSGFEEKLEQEIYEVFEDILKQRPLPQEGTQLHSAVALSMQANHTVSDVLQFSAAHVRRRLSQGGVYIDEELFSSN